MLNRAASVSTLLVAAMLATCGGDALDQTTSGTLHAPRQVTLGNLTTVLIDPNGKVVELTWRAYNTKKGDALHAPWEELDLVAPGEHHSVSDRGQSNGSLLVDGRVVSFDAPREQVVIRFGVPVATHALDASIQSKRPADLTFD